MDWIKKNTWLIIGLFVGAAGGWLYWKEIGCLSGTCPIKSNLSMMLVYGSLLGSTLFSTVDGWKKKKGLKTNKDFKHSS